MWSNDERLVRNEATVVHTELRDPTPCCCGRCVGSCGVRVAGGDGYAGAAGRSHPPLLLLLVVAVVVVVGSWERTSHESHTRTGLGYPRIR